MTATQVMTPPGLTAAQVEERLRQYGPNVLPQPAQPSFAGRAVRHLIEPLTGLLLGAAAISTIALRRPAEGLAILAIVVLNVLVASAQEAKAAGAMEALRDLVAPTVRVRRDGRIATIAAADLVPGDVVEVVAGATVPADLELFELEGLLVSEALLTGEATPVEKTVGDVALAGTSVLRGQALGVVRDTGPSTRLGRIAAQVGTPTEPPLLQELRSLSARMASLAVLVGVALVPAVLLRSEVDAEALADAALAGVALAVAALPEGLATVVVLALALGGHRLALRGAIVRQAAAIEALGAADVLCTDKTGTLTEGTLRLCGVAPSLGEDEMWRALAWASSSAIGVNDPIDQAILDHWDPSCEWPPVVARRPFDAVDRSTTVVVGEPGATQVVTKGAPETVLARCHESEEVSRLLAVADEWAARGERVLAVAVGPGDQLDAHGLEPLGLIAFEDPIRPTARSSVDRCHDGGLSVVLVTGDHPATAEAVARAVGIGGEVTRGSELAALAAEDRARALLASGVVARVEPEQKVELIEAHQRAGRIVAMTGDGINDAPALRRADVGVALAGPGSTDVAREAADVILTNGDLSVLADAVAEGRHIRWNLRSVVRYLLTGNLSEVLVVAGALVLLPELTIPFLPVQLLWLNLVTDGAPALALAADRNATEALGPSWPRHLPALAEGARLRSLAPRAAAVAGAALGAGLIGLARWGWADDVVRSQILLTLIVAHLLLALNARSRVHTLERGWATNPMLLLAVGGSLLVQVLVFCTETGRAALGLAVLPPEAWIVAASLAVLAIGAMDVGRLVRRRAARA